MLDKQLALLLAGSAEAEEDQEHDYHHNDEENSGEDDDLQAHEWGGVGFSGSHWCDVRILYWKSVKKDLGLFRGSYSGVTWLQFGTLKR